MSRIRNANRGTFKRFKKKQGALAVQTPLSSTAVERGSTRWLDGSRVDIEGILNLIGRMNASGVVDVTGTLNGSGTNNFDGINNLTGETHLTGPTDVAGNFEIIAGGQFKAGESLIYPDGSAKFGALGIASDGTMQAGLFELRPDGSADFGDLHIDAGGKLTSGQFELNPDGSAKFGSTTISTLGVIKTGQAEFRPNNGGELAFNGGSLMSGDLLGITLEGTTKPVTIKGPTVDLSSTNVRLPNAPNTDVGVPNVHMDSSGRLYRVTNP